MDSSYRNGSVKYSPDVKESLDFAVSLAKKSRHSGVSVEHLMVGLIECSQDFRNLAKGLGLDLEKFRSALDDCLADPERCPTVKDGETAEPSFTVALERLLKRAEFRTSTMSGASVTASEILISVYYEKNSTAESYLISSAGLTRRSVLEYLAKKKKDFASRRGSAEPEDSGLEIEWRPAPQQNSESPSQQKSGYGEHDYLRNLNEAAKNGEFDRLIGRDKEIERIEGVLLRRRKNNVILVGDGGTGKTAIIEGLAARIASGNVPKSIRNMVIYEADISGALAGCELRGMFEERLKSMLEFIIQDPNRILFIDEIHTIMTSNSGSGSDAADGGSSTAVEIMKPYLVSGKLHCIGTTTFSDYRQTFMGNPQMVRRFEKVEVTEPSAEEAVEIIKGSIEAYEKFHNVSFTEDVPEEAVRLSQRYITGRRLPDKAFDIIDECAADARLRSSAEEQESDEPLKLDTAAIRKTVSRMIGMPVEKLGTSERTGLLNLEKTLKSTVFGQDEAITSLADSIYINRAGLKPANHPIGVFMFAGPTGVGKTEVALRLADALGRPVIRIDMSEYNTKFSATKLIGSEPSYIGFREGGTLTNQVLEKPYSVVVLDEIEKADQTILNLMLQVFDNGSLLDGRGRRVDFTKAIIIMTTNAGVRETVKNSIGFSQDESGDSDRSRAMVEIKRVFTPEFRNRLDGIIWFHSITRDIILNIVDKFIKELAKQLLESKVSIEVSDEARHLLADKGYSRTMGARPMARTIREELRSPISKAMLFGELAGKGGTVHVGAENGRLTFSYQKGRAQKKRAVAPAVTPRAELIKTEGTPKPVA